MGDDTLGIIGATQRKPTHSLRCKLEYTMLLQTGNPVSSQAKVKHQTKTNFLTASASVLGVQDSSAMQQWPNLLEEVS